MKKLLLLSLLITASAAFAQTDFSKVEIKATKVAGSVYMLTGQGGNIGVSVGDDGIVIVDDQYAPLAPKILAALKSISDKPIKFVLNTHYHPDHTGGNEFFGGHAPLIAHENVRKRLKDGTKAWGRDIPPSPPAALPVVTFDNRLTIHLNGEDIRAIHFPNGHTDGDSIIWFTKSNVVHMGDDYFNGFYPVIDLDNGGSVRGLIANIEKALLSIPDDAKIIPGHGPLATKADLRAFATMLRETADAAKKAFDAGKTLDQMKADDILKPWNEKWGKGFVNPERYLGILYGDLTLKR